jgi:ATP-dependent phosphoenolpyruvate carboxykinase
MRMAANRRQIANASVAALYEDALVYETGSAITSTGALTAYSGTKTGRSPLDKRIVKEPSSENDVWWGPVNKPMTEEVSILFRAPGWHHVPRLVTLPLASLLIRAALRSGKSTASVLSTI